MAEQAKSGRRAKKWPEHAGPSLAPRAPALRLLRTLFSSQTVAGSAGAQRSSYGINKRLRERARTGRPQTVRVQIMLWNLMSTGPVRPTVLDTASNFVPGSLTSP